MRILLLKELLLLQRMLIENDVRNRSLVFKNNAPFTNCISKINNVLLGNAEDQDLVIPMYSLIEHSKNYRKTTGSLWNYYRDEPNNPPAANYNADPTTNSASFKYQTSIIGKTSISNQENSENTEQVDTKTKKNLEIVVSLKHLSNMWRTFDMSLINWEASPNLNCSANCALTGITTQAARAAQGDNPARPARNAPANAIIQITDTQLCTPLYQLKMTKDL